MDANSQRLDRQVAAEVVFAEQAEVIVGGVELVAGPMVVAGDRRQNAAEFGFRRLRCACRPGSTIARVELLQEFGPRQMSSVVSSKNRRQSICDACVKPLSIFGREYGMLVAVSVNRISGTT